MSKSSGKPSKKPTENPTNSKPISLYPMTLEQALRKALQADPEKAKKADVRAA